MLTGAEPYEWKGTNQRGVLLIHGFTGSPSELRELGEILHGRGYSVYGILLKGHGTDPKDMESATAEDWIRQVREGIQHLRSYCREVFVLGISMGGLLAICGAAMEKVDRLVLIATPVFIFDWRLHFLWLAGHISPYYPKNPRHVDAPKRYDVAYRVIPLAGAEQFRRLLYYVRFRCLSKVTAPCLIIQSRTDRTVRPESAEYLYQHITSPLKKIYMLKEGKHVITLYKERETVYQEILTFLEEPLE
jgi:carboxylesterase